MLVVEDGTGLPNAESYTSASDADAYFLGIGNTAWGLLAVEAKEAALRQATNYMESVYPWQGGRLTITQALSWPRMNVAVDGIVLDPAVIPVALKRACAELAMRASTAPLLDDTGAVVTRETIGPITVDYLPGTRQTPRYGYVEAMLSALLRAAGQLSVVRA